MLQLQWIMFLVVVGATTFNFKRFLPKMPWLCLPEEELVSPLYPDPLRLYREYVFPILDLEVPPIEDIKSHLKENNDFRKKCLLALHPDQTFFRHKNYLEKYLHKSTADVWEIDIASELLRLIVLDNDYEILDYTALTHELEHQGFFLTHPEFVKTLTQEQLNEPLRKLGIIHVNLADLPLEEQLRDIDRKHDKIDKQLREEFAEEDRIRREQEFTEFHRSQMLDDQDYMDKMHDFYRYHDLHLYPRVVMDKDQRVEDPIWQKYLEAI